MPLSFWWWAMLCLPIISLMLWLVLERRKVISCWWMEWSVQCAAWSSQIPVERKFPISCHRTNSPVTSPALGGKFSHPPFLLITHLLEIPHVIPGNTVRWFLGPAMNFYAHKDSWAGQPFIQCSIYSLHIAARWTWAPLQHLCEKSIM